MTKNQTRAGVNPGHQGNRLALVGTLLLTFWLLSLIDRIVLMVWTPPDSILGALFSLLVGFGYDFIALGWALMIPTFAFLVVPSKWLRRAWVARFCQGILLFALFLMLFNIISGWVFWNEFQSRYNFIAVDYLVYTQEVLDNIVESYPLPLILSGLFVVALILFLPVRSVFVRWNQRPNARLTRRALILFMAVPVAAFFAIPGTGTRISKDRVTNELAKDNLYALFSAFRSNTLEFNEHFASIDIEKALTLVREDCGDAIPKPQQPMLRSFPAQPVAGAKNVMMVMVESLDASFLEMFGGRPEIAPNMNELCKQSLVFSQCYATGSRTVRGLEAVTLSIPPTAGRSIVKRPDCEGLTSVGWPLKEAGFETKFMYGGYGYFDNMNKFFSTNGYKIVDHANLVEDEIRFANAWGVCDQDIFDRALKEADQSFAANKRFYTHIMTTSNHRPYTYPDVVAIPSGTGRDGAVQYTDFAIGEFLRKAKSHAWFDETIFVIIADHCSSSAGKRELNLAKHHIPLILYAPKLLPAKIDSRLASQIDLGPTLLSMLGVPYESQQFGLDLQVHEPNRAFVGNYQTLGYFDGTTLTYLATSKRVGAYSVAGDFELKEAPPVDPARTLTTAYYQVASYLYEKNLLHVEEDIELPLRR